MFSALDSGLLMLPGALVMGALGPIAGKLLDTIGIKLRNHVDFVNRLVKESYHHINSS
jgi:hypothetical protein